MGSIFNYDNKFFQGFNKVIDCAFISILWLIFSIPIVTIGPSTTAMYYTVHKVLRHGRGYVWQNFWKSFKENFKQTFVLGLIMLVAGIILVFDAYVMRQFLQQGSPMGFLYYAFLVLIVCMVCWMLYVFTYAARFNNGNKAILKNAAFIAILNLPKTLLVLLIFAVGALVMYISPISWILIPGLVAWLLDCVLEKIFRKYMSEEDLQLELEKDMENLK